jgi:TolB-like protein/DNA-binding winged helix-turn-helix (wHTH) protein/Tfp pilus assembly protein PilF
MTAPRALRFGVFELDLPALELRKAGLQVRLQQQPARVLALLARRAGDLVTREEIQKEVWGSETFVDFEQGLNFCIRQIRSALGDNADSPRFVETLPRRGYRFIAPVEALANVAVEPVMVAAPAGPAALATPPRPDLAPRRAPWLVSIAAAALTIGAISSSATHGNGDAPASSGPSPAGKLMLVVLPFENLSGDAALEYVSDGMTEEMITQLARVAPERLGVIARTSAMRYKKSASGVDQIGRDLAVDYLLEGSVRQGDGRVRVTAQLIQVRDQTHVWADSYEKPGTDALALQNDMASRVTRQVVDHLLPAGGPVAARAGTTSVEAYDAYLKGRYQLAGRDTESIPRAIAFLEQAVALDPSYALAHSALAEAYVTLGDDLQRPAKDVYPRARVEAEKALALDDSLAEAWVWLASVKCYYEWDLEGGRAAFDRAIALSPGLAIAHHYYADYLSAVGRHEDAIASVKRAQVLDPLSRPVNEDVGWYSYFAGHYAEAARQFQRTAELAPQAPSPHLFAGLALATQGDFDQAVSEARMALLLAGESPAAVDALLKGGGERAWRACVRHRIEVLSARKTPVPSFLFWAHAYLGDREAALASLESARDQHWRYLLVMAAAEPHVAWLRSDPRFVAVLRDLGLGATAQTAAVNAGSRPGS